MRLLKFILPILASFSSLAVSAQSAEWLVEPTYSEITFFGPDMYKVTKDGKVGIINSDGRVLVPAEYDAINLFYEGRTVVVNRSTRNSKEWKVMGILSEDGQMKKVYGEYYLLKNYMFFSEGFLPVKDGDGMYGFLDSDGKEAFDFIKDPVCPFSEGLAMVGSDETFRWVTPDGDEVFATLKSRAEIYGATNFYDGKCIIWDEDGSCYRLDNSMNLVPMKDSSGKKVSRDTFTPQVDYLLRAESDASSKVPYSHYSQYFQNVWIPESRDGKWSYVSNDNKLLMPYQYESTEKFSNGVAIAGMNGKFGMLKVVHDNSTFSISVSKNRLVYSAGKDVECAFHLDIPEKWAGQGLDVTVTDPITGKNYAATKTGNNDYSFSYKPSGQVRHESHEFNVAVNNKDICLWHGSEQYEFDQKPKSSMNLRVNNRDANENQQCYVTAIVKNTSSVPITTTITLSGGGDKASFAPVEKTVTIPANSSTTVKSFFKVSKVEKNGWVRGITSEGTSSRLQGLTLNPD